MNAQSKFIFALIILSVAAGWLYMIFVPSHTIENNLELNASYFPGITEKSLKEQRDMPWVDYNQLLSPGTTTAFATEGSAADYTTSVSTDNAAAYETQVSTGITAETIKEESR